MKDLTKTTVPSWPNALVLERKYKLHVDGKKNTKKAKDIKNKLMRDISYSEINNIRWLHMSE